MDFRLEQEKNRIKNIAIQVLTRSSSRIISAIPGLISQSSALAFGGSSDAIVIGSIEPAADKNGGMHFEL